ncbi:uncharacterized protein [Diadema antillarum]|uniref:uncharacterized protein n=1 Tax=Diadema antillarum TaxID=105358 RepID=UPI003A83FE26
MALTVISLKWVHRDIHGKPPSPRQGHAACVVGDVAYLFGGIRSVDWPKRGTYFFRDMHQLHLHKRMQWEKVRQTGDVPKGRYGHHMCVIGQKIFLFGGKHDLQADRCLSGLYVYNVEKKTWNQQQTSGTEPVAHSSAACVVGQRIYVFGGLIDGQAVDDIHCYDTDCQWWVKLTVTGVPPSPRCDAACAAVDKFIYVFGGTGGTNMWFNDIHVFNTEKLNWKILSRVEGDSPPPRGSHTFVAHVDKDIYVFGGSNDSNTSQPTYGDLYKFSLDKRKWKRPFFSGCAPARRSGHTAFIHRNKLMIIGGSNEDSDFNDVHVAKLINPSKRQPLKVSANRMHEFLSTLEDSAMGPSTNASDPPDAHFLERPSPEPSSDLSTTVKTAEDEEGNNLTSPLQSVENDGSVASSTSNADTSAMSSKSVHFKDESEERRSQASSSGSASSLGSSQSERSSASDSSKDSSFHSAVVPENNNNSNAVGNRAEGGTGAPSPKMQMSKKKGHLSQSGPSSGVSTANGSDGRLRDERGKDNRGQASKEEVKREITDANMIEKADSNKSAGRPEETDHFQRITNNPSKTKESQPAISPKDKKKAKKEKSSKKSDVPPRGNRDQQEPPVPAQRRLEKFSEAEATVGHGGGGMERSEEQSKGYVGVAMEMQARKEEEEEEEEQVSDEEGSGSDSQSSGSGSGSSSESESEEEEKDDDSDGSSGGGGDDGDEGMEGEDDKEEQDDTPGKDSPTAKDDTSSRIDESMLYRPSSHHRLPDGDGSIINALVVENESEGESGSDSEDEEGSSSGSGSDSESGSASGSGSGSDEESDE